MKKCYLLYESDRGSWPIIDIINNKELAEKILSEFYPDQNTIDILELDMYESKEEWIKNQLKLNP